MHRGCIWIAIAFIVLFLLVAGVILPRSILHKKERTQHSTPPVPTSIR